MAVPHSNAPSLIPGGGQRMIAADPRAQFCFVHNPFDAWDVTGEGLDGIRFLPRFYSFAFTPGVQGNRQFRNADQARATPEFMYGAALTKLRGQGHTVLWSTNSTNAQAEMAQWDVTDPSHLPEGVEVGSYTRMVPVSYRGVNGWRCVSAWETPMPALPGSRVRFKHNAAPFNRWRAHLVDSGLIAPPNELVLDNMRRPLDRRMNSARVAQVEASIKEQKIGSATALLDGFAAAMDHHLGKPSKPAPKTSKARSKA